MCIFLCVYWLEMLYAHLYVPPILACMPNTCMNPDLEFTVFKIVYFKILIMLGIKFITKREYF